jgi:DNA-binding MarR family transcriptional regulator
LDSQHNTPLDMEARIAADPAAHKIETRLWLRLLSCSNLISAEIRRRLRKNFNVTLPQFDLLAQLQREPDGLRLGELSRRLMVTNGNVTGLVDKLVQEGFIQREPAPDDRRAQIVRMTKAGASLFAMMAEAHETWLVELMAGVDRQNCAQLMQGLAVLKNVARRAVDAP